MRKAAGLTQRDLADRLKTVQTVVARLEQGERRLDLIEYYWFCKAVGVDPKKAAVNILKQCAILDGPSRRKPKARRR
jgi:transcriptional regulator with XRE-family HTH domain